MQEFSIGWVGAGNISHHLLPVFLREGMNIRWIHSRNPAKASRLVEDNGLLFSADPNEAEVDLVILAVPDSAVVELSARWKNTAKALVHTSGSLPVSLLAGGSAHAGLFYPLQTFSEKISGIEIGEIPLFIEADDELLKERLIRLCQCMGGPVFQLSGDERVRVHLAAVFAANFVTHMLSVSNELLEEYRINPAVVHPLLKETIRKAMILGPKAGQTGPALRNDIQTMNLHLEQLKDKPHWEKIYRFVSDSIGQMYARKE
jgi:predicted short-subunit dehydrogenase-like oxidoreductase (DUF2520 family)